MPNPPRDAKPYNPATTTTASDRQAQGAFLDRVLGQQPSRSVAQTTVVTKNNAPPPFSAEGLQDDPTMEMAIQLAQQHYPELFKGISTIYVGAEQPHGIGGQFFPASRAISLAPSGGNFGVAMNHLAHELSHSVGTRDEFDTNQPMNPSSAYDVGQAATQLNKNIYLPNESGQTDPRLGALGYDTRGR